MARATIRLLIVVVLVGTAGVTGVQAAAWARAPWWCDPSATPPRFDGDRISGEYSVQCLGPTSPTKLYGRIKEDRPAMPDVVHKVVWAWFEDDFTGQISKRTCQDDDAIYLESQIRGGNPFQGPRREMHC